MDFERIVEFTVIVKHKSLLEAAQELNTTQPVLSKHLATLEKELGVELLDRGSSPMELTSFGRLFLEDACSIAAEYRKMLEQTQGIKSIGQSSTIRIGGVLDTGALPLLLQAREKFTETHLYSLHLRRHKSSRQTSIALLQRHEIDIAFEPFSEYIDATGLSSIQVLNDQTMCVVEKTHRFANNKTVLFDELINETFVSLISSEDTCLRKCVRSMCEKHGFKGGLPTSFRLCDSDSYRGMFLEGLDGGIILVPCSTVRFFPMFVLREYAFIPIEDKDCFIDIRAFFDEQPSETVSALISCLVDVSKDAGV